VIDYQLFATQNADLRKKLRLPGTKLKKERARKEELQKQTNGIRILKSSAGNPSSKTKRATLSPGDCNKGWLRRWEKQSHVQATARLQLPKPRVRKGRGRSPGGGEKGTK